MSFDLDKIQQFYREFPVRIDVVRQKLDKPLTLTEKILYSHFLDLSDSLPIKQNQELQLNPDRVALRDANAQMALLQFAASGRQKTQVPATVHCDQLVLSEVGSKEDLARAYSEHQEIFDFLQSFCAKYGLGYWQPGAGIIHQVLLENYAFPGGMMIGSDAYISNAGGLCMLTIASGSSDIVGVMAGMAFEMDLPKKIGVLLTGQLQDWTAPKDVALKLWEVLDTNQAAGAILEFMGDGAATLSCSGKATICNMCAEVGAIASLFPFDTKMSEYLLATGREEIAFLAESVADCLKADAGVLISPNDYFDQIIEIDLSSLEPRISGPQGIEKSWSLSEFCHFVRQSGFADKLSATLIGSCINSSYEDMGKVASIARQAWKHGLKTKSALIISPGSEKLRSTLEREGHLKALEEVGSMMLASSCGPCSGLWKRHDVTFGEKNSIMTSFNKSFSGRFDGNPGTQAFVASPEIATTLAFAGRLTFNPMTDSLITSQGLPLRFSPPVAEELPKEGFVKSNYGFLAPAEDGLDVPISIDPDSKRLQLLKPFDPWNEKELVDMRLLIKVKGKSTAEHISPGGKWLKFRGNIDSISESMGLSLPNSFREEIGKGKNLLTAEIEPFAKVARDYKKEGINWIIAGEENYGEGSTCELVAMMPRYLGCKVVIAKSFAKACEINLKRQGLLALTFSRWEDYEKMREDDFLDLVDIKEIFPEKPLELLLKHADGTTERISLLHSYSASQIQWFKAGSAWNVSRG